MWDFKRWTFATLTELPSVPPGWRSLCSWWIGDSGLHKFSLLQFVEFLFCVSSRSAHNKWLPYPWRLATCAVFILRPFWGGCCGCRHHPDQEARSVQSTDRWWWLALGFIWILRSSWLIGGFHLDPPPVFFLVCAFRVLINVTSTMHSRRHTS